MRKFCVFILISVIVCIGLASCGKATDSSYNALAFDDVIDAKWTVLPVDDILPSPVSIALQDSNIVVLGLMDGYLLHDYSTKDGKYTGRHIEKGQGPDELIYPGNMTVHGKNVSFYDLRTRQLKQFDDNYKCIHTANAIDWFKNTLDMWPLADTKALAKVDGPDRKAGVAWYIIDLSRPGEWTASYDTIPECVSECPEALSVMDYATAISPDGKHFVTATTTGCVLQSFDIDQQSIKPVISEYLFPVKFDENGNTSGESYWGFTSLVADNERFYGVYIGSQNWMEGTKIGIWNWDGTPETLIQTDAPIAKIAISQDGKTIFGIVGIGEEYKLAKIELDI